MRLLSSLFSIFFFTQILYSLAPSFFLRKPIQESELLQERKRPVSIVEGAETNQADGSAENVGSDVPKGKQKKLIDSWPTENVGSDVPKGNEEHYGWSAENVGSDVPTGNEEPLCYGWSAENIGSDVPTGNEEPLCYGWSAENVGSDVPKGNEEHYGWSAETIESELPQRHKEKFVDFPVGIQVST